MNLLIITQTVDEDDQLLGFFIGWIKRFSRQFETVTVMCMNKGMYDLPENVSVKSIGKESGKNKLQQLFNFYFFIFNSRSAYDAVLVHMNPIWVVLGGFWWHRLGKKVFLWYTSGGVTKKLRYAEKFADSIFTASKESFRIPSRKVIVTGHGIDTELFKPLMTADNEPLMTTDNELLYRDITYKIRGAIFKVYNSLGFGHKELVYQKALELEFKNSGLKYESQKRLSVRYRDEEVGVYVPDFIIEDKVIVEIKSINYLSKTEKDQAMYYLKGSDYGLSLLINFGTPKLQIERLVWFPQNEYKKNQRKSVVENPRESVIKILSVGRIAPVKNYEVIVAAVSLLREENIDVSVTVVGDVALSEDVVYLRHLKAQIAHLGLSERFVFAGKKTQRELLEYYRSHDILVHTSKTGSLDKTVLEAMACGMAVISSSDAARAFLPHELTVAEDDSLELAHCIRGAAGKDFGAQLREYVVKNHNLDQLIEKISRIIKK